MQGRITDAENTIMKLEEQIVSDTEALVRASEKGDWQVISRLSKAIHDAKERINTLFEELEALTSEHDLRSREFEEQLQGLDQRS